MTDAPTSSCMSCGAPVFGPAFCEQCGARQSTRVAALVSPAAAGVPVYATPAARAGAVAGAMNTKARASFSLALAAIALNILSRAIPATASGISSIFAVLALAMLVVAIVLGHVARREIKHTNERGAGHALAGMLIGYIVFGIDVIAIVVVIAIAASYAASL